jgi:hypothetical protein
LGTGYNEEADTSRNLRSTWHEHVVVIEPVHELAEPRVRRQDAWWLPNS